MENSILSIKIHLYLFLSPKNLQNLKPKKIVKNKFVKIFLLLFVFVSLPATTIFQYYLIKILCLSIQDNQLRSEFLTLLIVIFFRFLFSSILSIIIAILSFELCKYFVTKIQAQSKFKNDINHERILSLDIPMAMEMFTSIASVPSKIAGMIYGIYFFYEIEQSELFIFQFLGLFIFILLNYWIVKKRKLCSEKIFLTMSRRVEYFSLWKNLSGLFYLWSIEKNVAVKLSEKLKREQSIRQANSRLRALDIYCATFGVVFLSIICLICKIDLNRFSLLTIWIFMLMIADLTGLTRQLPQLLQSFLSYRRLKEIGNRIPEVVQSEKTLYVDDSWKIFHGSMSDNLFWPQSGGFQNDFGLAEELGISTAALADFNISGCGANISSGQRSRVLLLRAINIAVAGKVDHLHVHHSLCTLDWARLVKIKSAFLLLQNTQGIRVTLSTGNQALFSDAERVQKQLFQKHTYRIQENAKNMVASPSEYKAVTSDELTGGFPYPRESLFLVVPALCLGLIGGIAVSSGSWGIETLILCAITGIFFGMRSGLSIEKSLRSDLFNTIHRYFSQSRASAAHDQIVSRDVTVITGKIAWYRHDLIWTLAGSLVGLIGMMMSGLAAAVIGLVSLALYYMIARKGFPLLIWGRKLSVHEFDVYLRSALASMAWGSAANTRIVRKRINEQINFASNAMLRCLWSKNVLQQQIIQLCALVSAAVLISAAYALPRLLGPVMAAIILTALLNADLRSTVLFSAILGYLSERISLRRVHALTRYVEPQREQDNNVRRDQADSSLIIEPFSSILRSKIDYQAVCLPIGKISLLSGSSGSGKSVWLKELAERSRTNVLYVNEQSAIATSFLQKIGEFDDSVQYSLSDLLQCLVNYSEKKRPDLIILDECFSVGATHESITEVVNDVISIFPWCTVLVVSHVLQLPDKIYINNIIRRMTV